MVVTQMYTVVKTHHTVHAKPVYFIICKLYLNQYLFLKPAQSLFASRTNVTES